MERSQFEISALLGILAGMRTSSPWVATAKNVGTPAWIGLVGELIGDKLPFTPDRTSPPAYLGRMASGALASVKAAFERDLPVLPAFVTGLTAAAVATRLTYELRKRVVEGSGLPDPAVALVEDAIVIALIAHVRLARATRSCR